MEPITLGLISLLALTVLLMTGMRIAFATAICGFLGLWMLRGYDAAAMLSATTTRSASASSRSETRAAMRAVVAPI